MVTLALSLGVYAYLIFALGLLGWLYPLPVLLITLPFLIFSLVWLKKNFQFNQLNWTKTFKNNKLVSISIAILGIQVLVNFLGALSPELSFDALWYHLTPAKLYAQNHRIFYFPGWLLWPANLPRLTEMFYAVALLFSNEILAKLIHFFFGILAALALFNLLKRYLSLRFSLLGVLIFYTMLIVGWQSTTAYVDLTRTFFEILALDYFLQWAETKKENFLWESAILTGLAMATKILALGTLLTFLVLIFFLATKDRLRQCCLFAGLSFLIVSPWLFLINTKVSLWSGVGFAWVLQGLGKLPTLLWRATLLPDDIISPVYLIFAPLVLVFIWREKKVMKIAALYFLLVMFFAPTHSNRYLLPYLPSATLVILTILDNQGIKKSFMGKFLVVVIMFSILLNLGGRILATRKFLPYLLGRQSKSEFLSSNLNFNFGDFYDIDGYFARNIKKDDLVLIYGIHNLYYVNFPYIHESWAKPGTYFTHILVGDNQDLPEKFGPRILVYQNPKTRVKLYLFGVRYK